MDADLRRSGVSRLIEQSCCFTLRDFLDGRRTANEVVALEERSGVRFVPSTPVQAPWTSQDIRRFTNFVDHLKEEFDVVIIDLPPILGLAETIRLSSAADKVALIIRWGRTERQFVQYAFDALRGAGIHASAAILNDIDLRAQHRRGYRDRTMVYGDENLYRAVPLTGEPFSPGTPPVMAGGSEASSELDRRRAPPPDSQQDRFEKAENPRAAIVASSDIQRLYDKFLG